MKLLFFSDTLKGGGAERVLVNITNELIKRGHDITIALNRNEIVYELDSRIKIVSAPPRQWYKGRNVIIRLVRNLLLNKYNSKHTHNTIKAVRPDVIVTFLHCNMKAILRYHGNIPIVHSEHNAFDRWVDFKYHVERFFLNRFYDKVFVLTPYDQGYAKAKGLKNTVIIPNPNTFSSITQKEYDDLFSQRKNILVCGRVQSWHIKGMDIAIEAFAKVAEQISNVDLDIAGAGDEVSINHLMQLAKYHNIENRVHFLGQRDDIQDVMQQHELFVLSSRTEGFPMVVTEAMSQGLPCVAFERLASSIVIDGLDGCLVKDGDTKGLSEAMVNLLTNEETRKLYGEEEIKNVNRFSSENIAKKWEEQMSFIV
jgi:glycosyltransferase involved in cell wall biosynthesis